MRGRHGRAEVCVAALFPARFIDRGTAASSQLLNVFELLKMGAPTIQALDCRSGDAPLTNGCAVCRRMTRLAQASFDQDHRM